MSHPPEPLLSHNEESVTEHRMSHVPETSRELAEQIWRDPEIQFTTPDNDEHWKRTLNRLAGIIDAWVRVREEQILEKAATAVGSVYSGLDAYADEVLAAAQKRIRAIMIGRAHEQEDKMTMPKQTDEVTALIEKWRKLGAFYEEKSYSALGDTVPTPGTVAIQCADDLESALATARKQLEEKL